DRGKPLTVVYSGGTEFNFVNDVPHFDTYLASVRRFAAIAAAAGATVIIGNQSQFDGAALKLRTLADRRPGEAHPSTSARRPWRATSKSKTNAGRRCASSCSLRASDLVGVKQCGAPLPPPGISRWRS